MFNIKNQILIDVRDNPRQLKPGVVLSIIIHSIEVEESSHDDIEYITYSFYDVDDNKLYGVWFNKLSPLIYTVDNYKDLYPVIETVKNNILDKSFSTRALDKMRKKYPSMTTADIQTAVTAMDFVLTEVREHLTHILK